MAKLPGSPVSLAKFVKIVHALGCAVEEQSAYLKVTHPNQPARRVYLAKSKLCHRIDLSGFEHPAAVRHPKSPSKQVTQWVDFTQPEAQVLRAVYFIVKDGLTVAAAPAADATVEEAVPELAAPASGTPGLDEAAGEALKNAPEFVQGEEAKVA